MKHARDYWISVAVLAVLHLYLTGRVFPLNPPVYLSVILPVIIIFLLSKRIMVRFEQLGSKENIILYSIQLLVIILYFLIEPVWGMVILPFLFIMIEVVRNQLGNRIYSSTQLLQSQSEEMEQMNETFLLVRKERHDFLKHISALHYMLENKNHNEAAAYLEELVEGYKETNLSIQGERGTIAGILHHNYQFGKDKGIEITYDLESAISNLPLSDRDLSVLIGNILENAIEASEEWQQSTGKKAHITLQTYKRSGLFILNCKNNTLPIPNEVLDHLYTKQAKSTKSGDHEGLGTSIIADTVKKCNGHLDFIYKAETFTLHIKLPAIARFN